MEKTAMENRHLIVVSVDAMVYEDLDRGLLMGLTMTIQEMEELGNPVHHMTRDARDYLMKRGIS